MKDVLFDNHSLRDEFNLILTASEIGVPQIKDKTVDIDGADGSLDLSAVFGRVFYKNRKLSFTYKLGNRSRPFVEIFSDVQNLLHGKKMDIALTDDEFWIYTGRVTVNKWKASKGMGELTVDVDASPFKTNVHGQSFAISGAGTYKITNDGFVVVPALVVTGSELVINNVTYSVGNHLSPTYLKLENGLNTLIVTGSGTGTLTWTERRI